MTVESSTADAAIALIKQVGFPAFVCCYFMFRSDRKMDEILKELTLIRGRRED